LVITGTSIIGLALPRMETDLGFTQQDQSRGSALAPSSSADYSLLGGRPSELLGARWIFTTGWAVLLSDPPSS
jgi:hypothetical protein